VVETFAQFARGDKTPIAPRQPRRTDVLPISYAQHLCYLMQRAGEEKKTGDKPKPKPRQPLARPAIAWRSQPRR